MNTPLGSHTTPVPSAAELVDRVRGEIVRREPDLRAWVALAPDIAEQARAVDDTPGALPLRGVSLGVKDLIDAAGLPTRAGSVVTSTDPVGADAACVRRLRALGAIVQGKTVTTEFGYFAPGPTRNPHALTHTPGGSSSGSAAAVAAGTIPLALGTQTAGSLTRPAAYCGAAAMVLAHGSTDMSGIVGLSDSLDSLGLLTGTVADLHQAYRAFTGTDEIRDERPAGTMFLWRGSELDELTAPMSGLLHRLPALIERLGVECLPLRWDDDVRTLAADHAIVMAYEAAATRARELAEHEELLSSALRRLLEQGTHTQRADYLAALARRDRLRERLAGFLGPRDLIIGPAALGPAPAGLAATGSPILSRPWQLLGLPVVVVPGASTAHRLPLGIQIIGQPGREYDMLALGIELEGLLRNGVRQDEVTA